VFNQDEQEIEEEDQQDLQGFDSIFHESEKMLDKLSQLHCMKQNKEEQYEQEMEELGKKAIVNWYFEMNPVIEDEFMSSDGEPLQPEHPPHGEGMEEQPQQKKEEKNGKKLFLNPLFDPKSQDDSARMEAMFDKMIYEFQSNSKFNDEPETNEENQQNEQETDEGNQQDEQETDEEDQQDEQETDEEDQQDEQETDEEDQQDDQVTDEEDQQDEQ
jgi:poly(rC)-binding protein 2/3/4